MLRFPIELRYASVAAAAIGLFVFGWRLRERNRSYAINVQGGALGVLYLTIFAALRIHPLIPAQVAFPLLAGLSAATGYFAIRQDALALAVFGVVGGFLAPVLASTGSGSPIALFSYYLVLNLAILYVSLLRSWRVLNLLGFAFTFVIASWWGWHFYRPAYFATTEPFLVANVLVYTAVAVLFAARQPPNLRGLVDGTLVFGTPAAAFVLQSELLDGRESPLALAAGLFAAFYALLAYALRRRRDPDLTLLWQSFAAIAVAFFTLLLPLALSDRWTAIAWALEGAALVWLGVRQQRDLSKLTGALLLVFATGAWVRAGWDDGLGLVVLNGNFLPAIVIAILTLWSAWRLALDPAPHRYQRGVAKALLLLGAGLWLLAGVLEIDDRVARGHRFAGLTAWVALAALLLALAAKRFPWHWARKVTLAYLPSLALLALAGVKANEHLLSGFGWCAWPGALAAHLAVLHAGGFPQRPIGFVWHGAGALLAAALIAWEAGWRVETAGGSDVWVATATLGALLAVGGVLLLLSRRPHWPFNTAGAAYFAATSIVSSGQLLGLAIASVALSGDPTPWQYVPIANPFDLLALGGLALAFAWVRQWGHSGFAFADASARMVRIAWFAAVWALTTQAVVRAVFHASDLAWRTRALFDSITVQSALSIYWAVLGLAGMIVGARRGNRTIWMAGTGLMALVVAKLFVIDLGSSGTVARIVSFLGVGVILLVVGYFAPAPPRATETLEDPPDSPMASSRLDDGTPGQ